MGDNLETKLTVDYDDVKVVTGVSHTIAQMDKLSDRIRDARGRFIAGAAGVGVMGAAANKLAATKFNFNAVMGLRSAPFALGLKNAMRHSELARKQFAATPWKFSIVQGLVGAEVGARGVMRGIGGVGSMALGGTTTGIKTLGVGVAATTAALAAGTYGTLKMGSGLEIMHRQTGFAIGRSAMLSRLLHDNHLEMDALIAPTAKMGKSLHEAFMFGGEKTKPFDDLGLNVNQLHGMNPADAFVAVGKAISMLPDQYARVAAATAVFGRSGKELLAIFADKEGFAKAAGPLSQKAILLEQHAAQFHRVSVLLAHSGDGLKSFFVGFTSGIAGNLESILLKFKSADLSGVGLKFAETMKDAAGWVMTAWQNPKGTFEHFWNVGKEMGTNFLGYIKVEFPKVFPNATAVFGQWKDAAGEFFNDMRINFNAALETARAIGDLFGTVNPFGATKPKAGGSAGALIRGPGGFRDEGGMFGAMAGVGAGLPNMKAAMMGATVGATALSLLTGTMPGGAAVNSSFAKRPSTNSSAEFQFAENRSKITTQGMNPFSREGLMGSMLGVPGMMMGLIAAQARGIGPFGQKTSVPATYQQAGINPYAGAGDAQKAAQTRLTDASRAPVMRLGRIVGNSIGSFAGAGFGRGWGTHSSMQAHPADGPDSLLSHREKRQMRNIQLTQGLAAGKTRGELGIHDVAAGDARRAKAFAKEAERKKSGEGSDNQLLSSIAKRTAGVSKTIASAFDIEPEDASA